LWAYFTQRIWGKSDPSWADILRMGMALRGYEAHILTKPPEYTTLLWGTVAAEMGNPLVAGFMPTTLGLADGSFPLAVRAPQIPPDGAHFLHEHLPVEIDAKGTLEPGVFTTSSADLDVFKAAVNDLAAKIRESNDLRESMAPEEHRSNRQSPRGQGKKGKNLSLWQSSLQTEVPAPRFQHLSDRFLLLRYQLSASRKRRVLAYKPPR
jgi:hypothetical protein